MIFLLFFNFLYKLAESNLLFMTYGDSMPDKNPFAKSSLILDRFKLLFTFGVYLFMGLDPEKY